MLDVDEVFTVEQLFEDYCIYYSSPIDYDMLKRVFSCHANEMITSDDE